MLPVRAGVYTTSIAHTGEQLRAAQRLRHRVFAGELGARLAGEFDTDEFDRCCDHLIVEHEPTGEVVGTYRLLPPGRSDFLYSQSEFELGALDPLRGSLVELGRSCVHPDHRGGAVIGLMWTAVARYAHLAGHRYLAGCTSVPLADGGLAAASVLALSAKHAGPYEVTPHLPWIPTVTGRPAYALVPPLLRGYLRLGAWICGKPAHDPDFGVADFFTLLPLDRIDDRYLRYFLGAAR
nr:GNAT family N-acyltransferase [Amycolatopsis albispora]